MELAYSFVLNLHIVVTNTIERKGLMSWLVKKQYFMHADMVKEGTEYKIRLLSFEIDCQYWRDKNLCVKLWFDDAIKYFLWTLEVGGMAALSKSEKKIL